MRLIEQQAVDSPRSSSASVRTPARGHAQRLPARTLRVLIVKRDKLGDLLLTTPVLAHLAAGMPQAEIHLLANDYNAWVVSAHPALHRTWTYARAREGGRLRVAAALSQLPLFWRLRQQRFDFAIVMGGDESHRGIRRAIASGATRIVAYASDPGRYGAQFTDPLPLPTGGHETARMLALLAPLGIAPRDVALDAPSFALPADARTFARDWLRTRGIDEQAYVLIGVGARRTKKQPTPAQIARWATRLHDRHGLHTVFIWTPGDARDARYPGDDTLAQDVIDRSLPFVHPFRGPIGEALGLIFGARASIIPDSGLMHFAAASPGGVLGLFADPADSAPASRWSPLGPRAHYIEAAKCVAELEDDAVFDALEPLISANTNTGSASDRCTS